MAKKKRPIASVTTLWVEVATVHLLRRVEVQVCTFSQISPSNRVGVPQKDPGQRRDRSPSRFQNGTDGV